MKSYKVCFWDKKTLIQVTWNVLAESRKDAIRKAKESHAENYNSRSVEVTFARQSHR